MPEKTVPAREPSSISMLAGWLRQGTESFFASQRILTDLVMRQNAHTIGAFQGRLTEARNIAGAAVTEIAGEGISSFIAAQRVLLNLAQRQNELLTTVVKERIDGPAPVAAVTDLLSARVDTVIGMHQHLLTMAARQTDEWIDATKSGEPFEGIHLEPWRARAWRPRAQSEEVPGRSRRKPPTPPAPIPTAPCRCQEDRIDRAGEAECRSLHRCAEETARRGRPAAEGDAKTAREAISAINPLPVETLAELTRHTLEGLVESEQDLLNVMVKPLHHAPKARRSGTSDAATETGRDQRAPTC